MNRGNLKKYGYRNEKKTKDKKKITNASQSK
jgi:hypothetical protein